MSHRSSSKAFIHQSLGKVLTHLTEWKMAKNLTPNNQVRINNPFVTPLVMESPPFPFPSHLEKHYSVALLATKPIKRPPLPLQRIHDIQTRHRLSLRMLCISDGVTDDTLQEGLEHTAGFFVDHYFLIGLFLETLDWGTEKERGGWLLAEIRLTPPRRARRRMAGLVIPWMLSRRILRWRLAPPLPRPLPPFPPVVGYLS